MKAGTKMGFRGLRAVTLGVHSAQAGDGTEALPVPVSLLVDANGKVLWIDRSENYQRRPAPDVVLAALREHLD